MSNTPDAMTALGFPNMFCEFCWYIYDQLMVRNEAGRGAPPCVSTDSILPRKAVTLWLLLFLIFLLLRKSFSVNRRQFYSGVPG